MTTQTTTTDPREIARRLTKAQREALLACPDPVVDVAGELNAAQVAVFLRVAGSDGHRPRDRKEAALLGALHRVECPNGAKLVYPTRSGRGGRSGVTNWYVVDGFARAVAAVLREGVRDAG